MKELLLTLAQAIVDNPDAVEVEVVKGEKSEILQLRVASEDIGKVIGKKGRIVTALRTILKAAATKEGKSVIVEVIE